MIALEIAEPGDFMQKLLVQKVFDRFYVVDAEIVTATAFRIEGGLNEAYYTNDEKEGLNGRKLCFWSEVKPVVYQIIKGKKLPVSFRIVMQLSAENTEWLLSKYHLEGMQDQLKGLYLNLRYLDRKITCITGLSYNTFIMDKTLEHIWDETAVQFMKQNAIMTVMV